MSATETLGAGRAMDALIAVRLFGWGWMTNDRAQVLPRARWLAPADELGDWGHVRPADGDEPEERAWWLEEKPINSQHWVVPFYSTDIAAAWLVVGAMERRNWLAEVSSVAHSASPGGPLWRVEFVGVFDNETYPVNAVGPNAPLAICRAALLATEAR